MKQHRKDAYEFAYASASLEAAIQKLIDELTLPSGNPDRWVLTEKEHREIIWPNLPDADRSNPTNSPESYYKIVKTFQSLVWPSAAAFRGENWEIKKISYRKGPEAHHALTLHYPGLIQLRDQETAKVVDIKFIHQVVEHAGRFKVSRVAP